MGISVVTLIPMHSDNTSVIIIASNPVFHDLTKYIKVDCHIPHQKYEKDKNTLHYVPLEAQLADVFIKVQLSTVS